MKMRRDRVEHIREILDEIGEHLGLEDLTLAEQRGQRQPIVGVPLSLVVFGVFGCGDVLLVTDRWSGGMQGLMATWRQGGQVDPVIEWDEMLDRANLDAGPVYGWDEAVTLGAALAEEAGTLDEFSSWLRGELGDRDPVLLPYEDHEGIVYWWHGQFENVYGKVDHDAEAVGPLILTWHTWDPPSEGIPAATHVLRNDEWTLYSFDHQIDE